MTDATDEPAPHLLRDARRALVHGTYFIRTAPGATHHNRPAVHVAKADTVEEARLIHKRLWNQGATPFLLVSLPGQVRVYTPFAFDDVDQTVGEIEVLNNVSALADIRNSLSFLSAESLNTGSAWVQKASFLTKERRVDRALLSSLRQLTEVLRQTHAMRRDVAHALVGRFVYLYYLKDRGIISDKWLASIGVAPSDVFTTSVRISAFRRVTDAVDARFNGHIFPIDWSAPSAPSAEAVACAGRAFGGESLIDGQRPLFKIFDFSYIPIELLSAIYEHFLHDTDSHSGDPAEHGAFYTPETLADYVLAEVAEIHPLQTNTRVLDPCCGSGIFLVLAYRRLVEQEMRARGTAHLDPRELRRILTTCIFGVERNNDACLVTEFSLILTLLSYIDPPELHRPPNANFKFPTLHGKQIFHADLFDDDSEFWTRNETYDWIVGNPPWVELDRERNARDSKTFEWIECAAQTMPVARYRTSEAFAWRVLYKLADVGSAGLLTQATSLTNDTSESFRQAFFSTTTVRRVINFSNLAYIAFGSAEEPAAALLFSKQLAAETASSDVIHIGPLVANQVTIAPALGGRRSVLWALTASESDIQIVPRAEAQEGKATTWKRALWGGARDARTLTLLRQLCPTTLGDIAKARSWSLSLGLQLRPDEGTSQDPNQDIVTIARGQGASQTDAEEQARWFATLPVLQRPRSSLVALTVPNNWLVPNVWGEFIRDNRFKGLSIISAPHVFLWNQFAAFSDLDFIFRHPSIGLAGPLSDREWLKAVAVLWTASITAYRLFLELSAGWGISRSTIDLGDAEFMPMPELTDQLVRQLSQVHDELATNNRYDRVDWQKLLDDKVAALLHIPAEVMLIVTEFMEYRLPLVKGKMPPAVIGPPDGNQLQRYAHRLKYELDGFMARGTIRHDVDVLRSEYGIVVAIRPQANSNGCARLTDVGVNEHRLIAEIMQAATKRYGQWVYVRRSVRVFSDEAMFICKPARRLEWTETQALVDAADIISDVTESAQYHEDATNEMG